MKTKLTLFVLSILSFSLFSQNKVVYSEDFENATVTATTLGNANAMNYGGGAIWNFGLETNYPITGSKSGYFNVTNTGSDWWTLQYRIDSKFQVIQGLQYKVKFKIQSSVANTILFKVQDTEDFTQTLKLKGGYEIETYSIITAPMDRSAGTSNFMWAFGTPAVPTEIWIDDIVIEEIQTTALIERPIDNVKVWSTRNKLIIDSPEMCTVSVYNLSGQSILTAPLKFSGQTTINTFNNKIVIVRILTSDGISKNVKVEIN